MRFKLIMALVDDYHTENILNAARKAGAAGATVVTSAHGEGITPEKTFPGLEIAGHRPCPRRTKEPGDFGDYCESRVRPNPSGILQIAIEGSDRRDRGTTAKQEPKIKVREVMTREVRTIDSLASVREMNQMKE